MASDGRMKAHEGRRFPTGATALAIGLLLLSAGCGKFYWNKAGAGADDFERDSGECARENFLYAGGTKEYGTVLEDRYKACLRSRGWVRAQHFEPPPGWFRGVESNQIVRFDSPSPQPGPHPR